MDFYIRYCLFYRGRRSCTQRVHLISPRPSREPAIWAASSVQRLSAVQPQVKAAGRRDKERGTVTQTAMNPNDSSYKCKAMKISNISLHYCLQRKTVPERTARWSPPLSRAHHFFFCISLPHSPYSLDVFRIKWGSCDKGVLKSFKMYQAL